MNTKVDMREDAEWNKLQKTDKKVLFLYASLNSGHQKAAQAIREALVTDAPEIETMDIEALGFSYPNLGKLVHGIYMLMAVKLSAFYDFLWDNATVEKKIRKLRKIINESSLDKFEELFASFKAKVAVCTQALPCGFLATLKQERGLDFKLIAVITDYDVHTYWTYEKVDVYCVATDAMKEKLIKRGILEEKIKVFGIPARLQFNQKVESRQAKEKIGLNSDLYTVLVMGGGYGVGPLNNIIHSLDKINRNFTMIIITGNNDRLYRKLEKKIRKMNKQVILFKYIENLSQVMQASDILITKPGGLTVTEALCLGIPMLITRGVRGQESGNFNYLISEGAAVGIDDLPELTLKFTELFDDNSRLKKMRENAIRIATPEAAMQISHLIGGFLE